MKQIRFTRQGASTAVGSFAPGDLARVDDALADHLVNEADVAEFVQAQAVAPKPAPVPPPAPAKAAEPERRPVGRPRK